MTKLPQSVILDTCYAVLATWSKIFAEKFWQPRQMFSRKIQKNTHIHKRNTILKFRFKNLHNGLLDA